MSFKQRLLNVTFVLGTGQFGDTGKNQDKLTGLRMSAKIRRAGGPGMTKASLEIYGMDLSTMNKLSTLGLIATTLRRNQVQVEAGDSDSMSVCFTGTITNAYPDFTSMPEVAFRVEALTGLIDAVTPSAPQSFPGPTNVANILAGIAVQLHVPFENNGVSVILPPSYFPGSLRNQALAAVEHAGICWNGIEDRTLAIWNPGESRGGQVPLISPTTGLVGYPSFNSNGIALRSLYNPSIGFGKKIQVQSSIPAACGTWVTYDLNHDLQSQIPRGSWFTDLQAAPPGLGPQVP